MTTDQIVLRDAPAELAALARAVAAVCVPATCARICDLLAAAQREAEIAHDRKRSAATLEAAIVLTAATIAHHRETAR